MGINVYGRKISENEKEVIYAYGEIYENLVGRVRIDKEILEMEIINPSQDKVDYGIAARVVAKAIRTFMKEGIFPENICRAS